MNRVSGWRSISAVPGLLRDHDAGADGTRRLLPIGDDIGDRRIIRVDMLDDREPVGMGALHFDGIAGVVTVQAKAETKIAPSTPTLSIAATISFPVTWSGKLSASRQGRCGVFAP